MCNNFFEEAYPTPGLKEFLKHIKSKKIKKLIYMFLVAEKKMK